MEDKEILELFRKRSEEAIDETSRKYGAFLNRIAYGILRSREDAEECVNDTYMRAWNNIPPDQPQHLSAFLGRITRNLALNRLEQMSASKRGGGQKALELDELEECIPAECDVQRTVEEHELALLLNRFLKKLTKEKRIIFMKRYWYFCTVEEIASELGCSESKVKMSLHRTREKLKDFLLKNGEGVLMKGKFYESTKTVKSSERS